MVRLEYEPFFDFSKVKLQKKKGSRFPSKSSRLAASINAASQHENETKKLIDCSPAFLGVTNTDRQKKYWKHQI